MATIKTDLICNLNQPVAATFLHGNLFSQDNAGNTINVHVMENGEPATIGGTVSANVIRADGNTVAVSGAIEGNKAYVILPQACYAVPGRVEIIIKLTQGTTITTIAAIVANVYRSTTDTVVDPGTIIPSIQTLIAEIEEAVDSIPVDYTGLLHTIAADYSSSKTYPVVGMYAWQGGVLKRNIVPITTAETYTAAHWTNAVIGDDLSALKSALNGIDDVIRLEKIAPAQTVNGYIRTNGNYYPSDSFKIVKYEVVAGTKIYINANKVNEAVYQFQDSNSIPNSGNTHIIGETVQESYYGYVTVPTGATWLLISDDVSGKNGIYNPNTDKVFEFVDNFTITGSIPGEFNSLVEKCTITLAELTSKKVFVSNKNLLPQFPAITDHGVTCVKNADGSITLSGTSTAVASFQLSGNVMPHVGPGTYTLSARNPSAIGDNSTYINPAINGAYSSVGCRLNTVDAETTFTLTEGQYISAIRIRIAANVTLPSNYTLYPQLEVGEEKTAFIAHKDYIVTPTANPTEMPCFAGYNYICAQNGVGGFVSYYFDAPDALNELNNRVTALENRPSASKKFAGKKIVCFGDSITGNFQAPTDYPSMIADLTGATVYNAGFGGCCMCDNGQTRRLFTMCRLVDSIVAGDFSAQRNSGVSITYGGTSINYVPERLDTLESIDWSEIDYITIAYGTNDWNSNYGLDNENNLLDTTTYIGAFRYSVEKLLTAYPNIKIMVITPLWRWWDTNTGMPSEIHSDYIDSNDYAKGTGYKLWQYGDALVSAAKLYHVPVFDLYWNCMMNKQNRFQYFNTTDGTHPKQEGRELMAELISAHLESVY